MTDELRCLRCGDIYPSVYWFKVKGICIICYPLLSDEERRAYVAANEVDILAKTSVREFPTILQGFLIALAVPLLSAFTAAVAFALGGVSMHYMKKVTYTESQTKSG